MNEIKQVLNKYNYKIEKISILNNVKIIDTGSERLVVKKNKKSDTRDLFKYLNSKNFHNYLDYINSDQDNFIIFPYIDTVVEENDQKAKDLIYIIANLHAKTTFYKEISVDEIKKIYEERIDILQNIEKHYENKRKIYEEIEYLSPSEALLLTNISWIFHSINSSKYFLDKWYEEIKTKKNKRVCLIHGNLELNHFLNGENKYIISWDNAKNDIPIYDLLYLYNNEYKNISFYDCLRVYEELYPLSQDERNLFFSFILTPYKINENSLEIIKTREVYSLITKLKESSNIISKYHSSNANSKSNKKKE